MGALIPARAIPPADRTIRCSEHFLRCEDRLLSLIKNECRYIEKENGDIKYQVCTPAHMPEYAPAGTGMLREKTEISEADINGES